MREETEKFLKEYSNTTYGYGYVLYGRKAGDSLSSACFAGINRKLAVPGRSMYYIFREKYKQFDFDSLIKEISSLFSIPFAIALIETDKNYIVDIYERYKMVNPAYWQVSYMCIFVLLRSFDHEFVGQYPIMDNKIKTLNDLLTIYHTKVNTGTGHNINDHLVRVRQNNPKMFESAIQHYLNVLKAVFGTCKIPARSVGKQFEVIHKESSRNYYGSYISQTYAYEIAEAFYMKTRFNKVVDIVDNY